MSKPNNTSRKPLRFEDAMARLEQLVAALESGELELDDTLAYFEEGLKLTRLCDKKLSAVETKVEKLTRETDTDIAAEADGKDDPEGDNAYTLSLFDPPVEEKKQEE